jgi:hypothetical protein
MNTQWQASPSILNVKGMEEKLESIQNEPITPKMSQERRYS